MTAITRLRQSATAATVAALVLAMVCGTAMPAFARTGAPSWLAGVTGLRCVHRHPWVCQAPEGKFTLTLTLGSAGVAYIRAHNWMFTGQGTRATIDLGTVQPNALRAGVPVRVGVAAQGSGALALAFAQGAAPLTVYVGAPALPPWPGTARLGVPGANIEPPFVLGGPLRSRIAQESAFVAAMASAQAREHTPAWHLPRNFARLSLPEQVFVLTDLERVTRGLWPLWGMTTRLDALAAAGARAHTDPVDRSASTTWASNWFSGTNPAQAMFGWMYQDGPGAWGENIDCPKAGAPGCWGHRRNILGDFGPFGLMGAADVPAGGTTQILVWSAAPATTGVVYTWAEAVRQGARPAN